MQKRILFGIPKWIYQEKVIFVNLEYEVETAGFSCEELEEAPPRKGFFGEHRSAGEFRSEGRTTLRVCKEAGTFASVPAV
jgi:hypothetical protein